MRWIAASGVVGLALMAPGAMAGPGSSEPTIVYGTCSVCHGQDGISPNATFPNLAGQTKPYLKSELEDFREHTRADHDAKAYMWGMADHLSDKTFDSAAEYFSALKPPKGASGENSQEVAAGKKIFEQGIASENVPACQSCHGAKAAGDATFPRLAGQHREYLVAQLKAFRSNDRNDPIMSIVAQKVTDEQIRAVAAYLASL